MPKPQDSSSPAPATPNNRRTTSGAAKYGVAGTTPKSAPAAVPGLAGGKQPPVKKTEPTLLGDFLLGRPSPQRVAAQRAALHQQTRRKSTAAMDSARVREELRQEMRAAAVRKLQQPGGIRDRVKAWQKANASAMKAQGGGVPDAEDNATEPTEICVHVDAQSVTEEDRVRIKMRQKAKRRKPKSEKAQSEEEHEADGEDHEDDFTDVTEDDQDPGGDMGPKARDLNDPRMRGLPKKRIVSDEHWMKRRKGKSPPRARGKGGVSPSPIPKDFLQKTAQNPSVKTKIKDWALRVEIPDSSPPKIKRHHHGASGETVTTEEDSSYVVSSHDDGIRVRPVGDDDGIRVIPSEPSDQGTRVKPRGSPQPRFDGDDGIRIRPVRKKEPPDERNYPDDGIRVRPSHEVSVEEIKVRPASNRHRLTERSTRIPSTRREKSPSDVIEVIEESSTEVDTPTKKRMVSRSRSSRRPSPTTITETERTSETESRSEHSDSSSRRDGSRGPRTVLGNKSLADIPVGYSAFSVLDLSSGAGTRTNGKRPKAQRNPSFKTVPKVFKKVVSGAKEIIHDKVDPPKPVVNQPTSIESWLDDTIDPFVEKTATKSNVEKDWAEDSRKKPSSDPRPSATAHVSVPGGTSDQENADPQRVKNDPTPKKEKDTTPTSGSGLKRSRATRSSSSPVKFGVKKPFREVLRQAFRGESGGHKLPPTVYPSCEASYRDDFEQDHDSMDDYSERREARRHSGGSYKKSRSPSPVPSSTISSSLDSVSAVNPPLRRKPPTNGVHELSTIVSEKSSRSSARETDTIPTVSQTTVTQTTALTRSTDMSRQKSQRSGLKRRLTKHSDLVSVLSLPDDGHLLPPTRSKSIKSSRSIHRKPSNLDRDGFGVLLQEFADDEHFYQRELKTLVDGVVPVLLTQVVQADRGSMVDLFAADATARSAGEGARAADSLAKSVVNMGIALEKLKNYHRRAPVSDMYQLLTWLESVYPIYDNYLDVWRLGFQDLIVNLAPAAHKPGDEDSLLNGVPLNEDGDMLSENGERVDVAHLLKRPLVRVKWMNKFLKAAATRISTEQVEVLLNKYERLQEKVRKRHREETARIMDEDAAITDTTRCRDLRTLAPLDGVMIERMRQVAAKDAFSLDLEHSSGQRLECRVELIQRDRQDDPLDKGDILIRGVGSGPRSWLFVPPVPTDKISARRGNDAFTLVVMVRGMHNGREWHEVLEVRADSEEQITDWLGIMGSTPEPPVSQRDRQHSFTRNMASSPKGIDADVPVGEKKLHKEHPSSPEPTRVKTPSRYHSRQPSSPSTPTSIPTVNIFPDHTPIQESYLKSSKRRSLSTDIDDEPSHEEDRSGKIPKTAPNSTPYREDGAPPPPIHRSLGSKNSQHLTPPVDLRPSSRVKRRGSSPLKHEYHPSDVSSESSGTETGDSSEISSESSGDELTDEEVPETIPGFSIKDAVREVDQVEPTPVDSVVSEVSLTPSNSASQRGLGPTKEGPEIVGKFVASVSYWSTKKGPGQWKEISESPYSVVVVPGGLEVHQLNAAHSTSENESLESSASSEHGHKTTIVALPLTPLVMIRKSTSLDLEIRGKALSHSRLAHADTSIWRFRSITSQETQGLYDAVHYGRLNNEKFIQLEEEHRWRSFGQGSRENGEPSGDGSSSSHRRGWFGRKNSYRASTRAPSQSQGSNSTGISASSFLARLRGDTHTPFNIEKSTIDRQSRPSSVAGGQGPTSLYTSSSSSGYNTPQRSSEASAPHSLSSSRWSADYGGLQPFSPDKPLIIRAHLNIGRKWSDRGSAILQIMLPPPGVRQELTLNHGLEKRIVVTSLAKRDKDKPLILLDAVLGSQSFSHLGTKGILCSIWEDVRDEKGRVGVAPRHGGLAGRLRTWCFQCSSVPQANFIWYLVTTEVPEYIQA